MDDTATTSHVTPEAVLAAFDDAAVGEPLTSREVAEAVGCSRRTAYNKLRRLASRGDLGTKKVGARARVWWHDPSMSGGSPRSRADDVVPASVDAPTHRVEVDFSSERLGVVFGLGTPPPARIRFDVAQDVPLPGRRRLQYYTVTGIGPRELTAAFEAFPSIESVRLLSTVGGVSRVEILVTADSVTEAIRGYDGRITGGVVDADEYRITARFPAGTDTAAVAAASGGCTPTWNCCRPGPFRRHTTSGRSSPRASRSDSGPWSSLRTTPATSSPRERAPDRNSPTGSASRDRPSTTTSDGPSAPCSSGCSRRPRPWNLTSKPPSTFVAVR
nr:bacterio-opsin activator domain-containing protein [Halorarius halobius]